MRGWVNIRGIGGGGYGLRGDQSLNSGIVGFVFENGDLALRGRRTAPILVYASSDHDNYNNNYLEAKTLVGSLY
jgi:hypothetical protein